MKKHLLFVALATIFSVNLFAQEPAKPTTVPGAPTMAEEHVMALYCNHYEGNTLNFAAQGWGTQWETLTIEGTKVLYASSMAWDAVKGAEDSNDLSGYEKLHFDLWVPEAAHVKFTIEALNGYKKPVDFNLNQGWNTIDADTAWWGPYDWKDLKCVIFEGYTKDGTQSFEGNPFAFANVYFWSTTTTVEVPDKPSVAKPETAPAVPTLPEENVMALYCNHYQTNNLNFNVLGWGGVLTWETLELGEEKTKVLYCQDMKWEILTNWDKSSYDFSGYEKFHFDIWAPFACNIKVKFEALGGLPRKTPMIGRTCGTSPSKATSKRMARLLLKAAHLHLLTCIGGTLRLRKAYPNRLLQRRPWPRKISRHCSLQPIRSVHSISHLSAGVHNGWTMSMKMVSTYGSRSISTGTALPTGMPLAMT